jgi:hypothetical protein
MAVFTECPVYKAKIRNVLVLSQLLSNTSPRNGFRACVADCLGAGVCLPYGLSASRRLLFLCGPSAVSGFVVAIWIRVPIYRRSLWLYSHVPEEHPKTIAPSFPNSNAASAVVLVLRVVLVRAALNHLPPTVVSRPITFAEHRFAVT